MGKTAQLIALLLSRPPTDSGDLAALVLTPEHLCHQWRSEIARFAGDALSVVPDEPTARKLADARNELANQARDAKLRAASSSGFDKLALCGNQISGTPRHRPNSLVDFHTGLWPISAARASRRRERSL